jgi:hypothetical protein
MRCTVRRVKKTPFLTDNVQLCMYDILRLHKLTQSISPVKYVLVPAVLYGLYRSPTGDWLAHYRIYAVANTGRHQEIIHVEGNPGSCPRM